MNESVWNIGGMILHGANQSTQTIPCPSATLSTTNLKRYSLGSNLGLCGWRTATNCL